MDNIHWSTALETKILSAGRKKKNLKQHNYPLLPPSKVCANNILSVESNSLPDSLLQRHRGSATLSFSESSARNTQEEEGWDGV